MDNKEQSLPVFAITAALGAVILLLFLVFNIFKKDGKQKNIQQVEGDQSTQAIKSTKEGKKTNPKKGNHPLKNGKKAPDYVPFAHPWLVGTLKGHSGSITSFDFSPNGKYIVTSSEDRVVMIWSAKEFSHKEHKCIRGNVTYDAVSHVAFSPDSRAFIGCLTNDQAIRVFKMAKKTDGSNQMTIAEGSDFPVKHDVPVIIAMSLASNGRFLMTCGADTTINLWSPKGDHLTSINTNQMKNSCCKVSACGRFLASSGFTPDVKIWEVCFDKAGDFKEIQRAFELKGHKAGIYSFDFNNDSSRMASLSKDGTWKLWNTDVQYHQGQDAKLLFTCNVSLSNPSHIAISPDGLSVAIASNADIAFYSHTSSSHDALLENVHSEPIIKLSFDPMNRYLVSCGGRQIQVIHNVVGHQAAIKDFEEKLKTAKNSSLEQRLKKQLQDKRDTLSEILSSPKDGTTKVR